MTVPFLRSGGVPSSWKELVLSRTESSTNKAFDLANSWKKMEGNHPLGGSSNEEVLIASPVDDIVSTPTDSSVSKSITFIDPVIVGPAVESADDKDTIVNEEEDTNIPKTLSSEEVINAVSRKVNPYLV